MEARRAAGLPVLLEDYKYELEVFTAIGSTYDQHDFVGNANVLTWLLGRKPTSMEEYTARQYARFQAASQGSKP